MLPGLKINVNLYSTTMQSVKEPAVVKHCLRGTNLTEERAGT